MQRSTVLKAASGTLALGALGLSLLHRKDRQSFERIEKVLLSDSSGGTFDEAIIRDLPEPAQRYFLHAAETGAILASFVRIRMIGWMSPKAGRAPLELVADEILRPDRGFVWTAALRVGPVPVRVRDHYVDGEGGVSVRALGIIPVERARDRHVARSARHRAAAESVWVPSMLLPTAGAMWEAVDDTHVRVTVTIDEEAVPLTLSLDDKGGLLEIRMMRYGSEGVDDWQLIPYGFRVEEERRFGGYTIPSKIRGGWWYGTERFDPASSATFVVIDAQFG